MEVWELVRRLLASANGRQSFSPVLVIQQYKRDVESRGAEFGIETGDLEPVAEEVAELMKSAGLLTTAPQAGRIKMLGAVVTTEFGDQLSSWLEGDNVVMLFESMFTDIERGAIQRLLHQLES